MHLVPLLALNLALAAAGASDEPLLKIGEKAPPFSMRDLDRQVFALANHLGPGAPDPRKAVLVVFFATYCEPCKKEIPIIKKIFDRWSKSGVEIVYIGLSQGPADLGPFVKQVGMPWRVVPDSYGLLARRYGASQLPHLLLLDKEGTIKFQHRGIAPDIQKSIENELTKATGLPVPPGLAEAKPAVAAAKPEALKTMLMGRTPSTDEGAIVRWEPLAVFLGDKVKATIHLDSEESYAAYEAALLKGKYDLVNAGPLLCNRAKSMYEPLVVIERQNTPSYLGIIFTLRGSKAKKLADLKDQTVGLVSPESSSGGLYPLKALINAGLVPGKTVQIKWLGSHAKVAEAVKKREVEAGGCFEDCRDAAWKNTRGKAIATRVLEYTEEIPAEMIAVKRSLDPAVKEQLRQALLALNENQSILVQISQNELPITAMAKASDENLKRVAEVQALVDSKSK
jgi:phosphate/phosphite/phosphonate ABC transporter binding protein